MHQKAARCGSAPQRNRAVPDEVLVGALKHGSGRIALGQREPHYSHGPLDLSSDFQQLESNRIALRRLKLRPFEPHPLQCGHEHVSDRREPETKLVGSHGGAACTIGEQTELLFLDAILHVAASAVHLFIPYTR